MKTALDPRHLRRQKIVQEIFAWQQNKTQRIRDPKTKDIITNITEIDQSIRDHAPEWETDKINHIDLAILRLASFELLKEKTEPQKAIIDEAIELAKEFGNDTSPSFINGVLGALINNSTNA